MSILKTIKEEQCGYLYDNQQIEKLAEEKRLQPVLVRCGGGRFICPAQDTVHFINAIKKSEMDYIRDVSLPVGN